MFLVNQYFVRFLITVAKLSTSLFFFLKTETTMFNKDMVYDNEQFTPKDFIPNWTITTSIIT